MTMTSLFATAPDAVSALLMLVTDPQKVAERLRAINFAMEEHNAAALAADTARSAAEASKADLDAKMDAAAGVAAAQLNAAKQQERILSDKTADLDAREAALALAQDDLAQKLAAYHVANDGLQNDLSAVSAREKTLSQAQAALADQEVIIAKLKTTSEALIAEYQEKLSKLRAIAG